MADEPLPADPAAWLTASIECALTDLVTVNKPASVEDLVAGIYRCLERLIPRPGDHLDVRQDDDDPSKLIVVAKDGYGEHILATMRGEACRILYTVTIPLP